MKRELLKNKRIKYIFLNLILSLIIAICLNSNNIENIDSGSPRIIFKEIKAERTIESITEKNLKYIDGKNAFRSEHYIWALANILYNRDNFTDVQDTGGKYKTIFGNINNLYKHFDPYNMASYLTNEELGEQVKWHNTLQITDFASYKKYHSTLNPDIQEKISRNKGFTLEKQYEKLTELFNFYKKAYENGSWVLMHEFR